MLVVEDDPAVRDVLVETLVGEMGIEVVGARSGAEALEQIGRRRPALVLLDLGMPDMDGLTVMARLSADPATRGLRVLATTALGRAADERRRALEAGCLGILEKPFEIEDLIAMVRALLPGEAD